MSGAFDAYYTWLGIPPEESAGGVPNHYRLLGLALFESNPSVIDHAADRVLIHLRTLSSGPQAAEAQRIMNEVLTARICLLDPSQRQQYDALLRRRLGPAAAPSATPASSLRMPPAAAPPVPKAALAPQRPVAARPIAPVPLPKAQPLHATPVAPLPVQAQTLPAQAQPSATPAAPLIVDKSPAPTRRATARRKNDEANMPMAVVGIVKVVIGGLGGLSMALLIVWVFFRADPLGLFATESGKATTQGNKKPKVVVIERPADRQSASNVASRSSVNVTNPPVADNTAGDSPKASSSSTAIPAAASGDESPPPMPLPVQPVEPPQPAVTAEPVERLPQPPQAEQQAKLAELKQIYKSEFEASTRQGRETFPDFLLATADKVKSDPVARFVLFREAFTRLVAARQFDPAVEVVDRLDQEFVLDPFALRIHTLTKASETAKLPADKLRIVLCASELADLAMRRQRLGEATTLARMADGHARGLPDGELKNRIGALRAEVEKAAEQWGPVDRARQALAADPSDAAAAAVDGRYRCLVEGDWQAGLALLAKSNDQQLAAAAQQDAAGVTANTSAAALGDLWYELAKSDSKLAAFYARARHWYRQAAASTTGLEQIRVQQRVEQIEAMSLPERLLADAPSAEDAPLPSFVAMFSQTPSFQPVDLFRFVKNNELILSPWDYADQNARSREAGVDSDPKVGYGRLPAHFTPPREYQMSLEVVRLLPYSSSTRARSSEATGPLVLGLVGPRGQFAALIDLPVGGQYVSSLAVAGASGADNNPTLVRHASPLVRASYVGGSGGSVVACQVRRTSVTVLVDGRVACQYEGDLGKLVLPKEWAIADKQAVMLGAHLAAYNVRNWRIEPVPKEGPPAFATQPPPGQPFPPGFAPPPPAFSP